MSETETLEIIEQTEEVIEKQEILELQEAQDVRALTLIEPPPEPQLEPPTAAIELRTYFDGELLELIGIKLLCLLLYPVLPALLSYFCYELMNIGSSFEMLPYFILAVIGLFVLFSACPDFLIWKWETNHTVIKDERLFFKGNLLGVIWLKIEILFFTVITLGLYRVLLANVTAKNRYRYKNTACLSNREGISTFAGSVFTIFGITVFFGIIHSICTAITSGLLVLAFLEPLKYIDPIRLSTDIIYGNYETILIRYLAYVPGTILSALMIYTVFLLVKYTYRYFVLRWEVCNVIIAGKKWNMKKSFLSYIFVLLVNSLLGVLTLGFYSLLGIDYYFITKFKVKNII